jgi:predicted DNA-binding transcriptional regulator YafY
LEKHLGNAWRMIRGNTTYQVELRFAKDFAETITDTIWHPTQAHQNEPDGSIVWTCTVDGLDEIVWWVLSMGAHCTVLQPPELAQRVQKEAAQMLALYGDENHGQEAPEKKMATLVTKQ